jgi:predicted nucleic acid-binding protein
MTEAARAVVESAEGVAVPALWQSECANALVGLTRRGYLDIETALEMYRDARAVFAPRETQVNREAAIRVADERRLSAYDAEYLVLAQELGCKLVTNDRRLVEAAPETAVDLQTAQGGIDE